MFIRDCFRKREGKLLQSIDTIQSDKSADSEKDLARQQIIDQFEDLLGVIDMYDSQLAAIEQSISNSRQLLFVAACKEGA